MAKMIMNPENKTNQIAKIVSNLLHPYVVTAPAMAMLALTSNPQNWFKWIVIALLPAYLLPLLYMQTRVTQVIRKTGVIENHRSLFREQPKEMLLLVSLFGIPSLLILSSLKAPLYILGTLMGLGATALLITLINTRFRASFHLSHLSSLITSVTILFGPWLLFMAVLIPLLATSRYVLKEHTPLQLATGLLTGIIATAGAFQFLKLIHYQ